jgi:hypothetical protein
MGSGRAYAGVSQVIGVDHAVAHDIFRGKQPKKPGRDSYRK